MDLHINQRNKMDDSLFHLNAFSINESFDRILLERLLPQDLSKASYH